MKNSFRPANYTLTLRPVTIALLFLFFLTMSRSAYGQWTTTGSDIYNSNSGNVGIGTTTPSGLLEVKKSQSAGTTVNVDNPFTTAANSAYSGLLFKQNGTNRLLVSSVNDNHGSITPGTAQFWNFANGPIVFANNNAETMRLTAGGYLGIGTNSPGERLVTMGNMLVGNITSHTQLYSTYDSQSNSIMEIGYGTATANITPLASLVLSKNLTSTNQGLGVISFANSNIANGNDKRLASMSAWTDGALNSGALVFGTTASGTLNERLRIASTGKIGVGTTTPTAQFHIMTASSDFEALRLHRNVNTNGYGVVQYFTLNNSSGAGTDYAQITGWISSNTAGAENGVLAFSTRGTGTLSERMRITEAGTVGIGLPNPNATYRLDVSGSINTSGSLCIANDCKASWSAIGGNSQWTTSGTTINYSTGNVGIGVPSPTTKLDVAGTVDADAFTVNGSAVVSSQWANGTGTINYAGGNVGIATPNPSEKLHVTGNVKVIGSIDVSGNINAKYQDVAEWVESSQELPAGTVVVLDDTKSNQVVASTQAYDSRVAGVISLKPGIALGERGDNHVLVATTGRVKVKVDATNGPIKIGDLLVTSDKEGVAMKSLPIEVGGARIHRPGTLIGKALEPLAQGTGEILVLLSLQ